MDCAVRVALVAGLGLVLAGCPDSSDTPEFTTGMATDPMPPNTSSDPSEGQDAPRGLFEPCVANGECAGGLCVIFPQSGGPTEPGETDGVIDDDDFGDPVGLCLRSCATLFECPEVGWTCDQFLGACVPETIPAG